MSLSSALRRAGMGLRRFGRAFRLLADGSIDHAFDQQQRVRERQQQLEAKSHGADGASAPPGASGSQPAVADAGLAQHVATVEANLRRQQDAVQQTLQRLDERLDQMQVHLKQLDKRLRAVDRFADDLRFIDREASTAMAIALHEDDWLRDNKDKHRGERCYLLGCGPSLNRVDLTRLRGEVVMGVNGTYSLDDIKLTYFASVSHMFWRHHEQALKDFRCERRFLPWHLNVLRSDCPTSWFNFADRTSYARLSEDRHPWEFSFRPQRVVFGGGTVIFPCLQILYHLGFEQVVLLGLDHDYGTSPAADNDPQQVQVVRSEDLKAHFRDDYYSAGGEIHIDIHTMERAYAMARRVFENDGRQLVNASPGTRLETIPRVDFDSVCP